MPYPTLSQHIIGKILSENQPIPLEKFPHPPPPPKILFSIFHSCPPNVCITLTIVEPGLKVRIWPVLHEYALCQISVHYDLGSHGADRVHQFAGNLVLLPVSVWQVVIAVAGVKVEAIVLSRGIVNTVTGRQGTKYFNL